MKNFSWMTELRGGKLQNVCLPFLFLLLPVFFLTIKSWTNTIALIIVFFSIFGLVIQPSYYFSRRGKLFWLLFMALTIPFACELIIQLLRSPFYLSALDGPLRFLLGAITFVFLTKYERNFILTKSFMLGCLLSVFATFFSVFFIEDYFWGGRAATYFVDPNSLPVYSGILSCASLYYINIRVVKVYYKYTLYISVIAMYLYIIHVSQTRTAWLPALVFIPYFLTRNTRSKWFNFTMIVLAFKITIIIFYFQNPTFRNRFDNVSKSLKLMNQGNFTTSLGVRVNLVLAEIELLKMEPIYGFEDGAIPSFEILKKRSPTLDLVGYSFLSGAGSHIEITAQLVRKGLILGSITVLALFIFPAFYFLKSQREVVLEVRNICEMSFCIVFLIFIPSFGIQVFNLKMYSTFWAIFLSLFYAVTFTNLPKSRTGPDKFLNC
jgi:O-antigen ligase